MPCSVRGDSSQPAGAWRQGLCPGDRHLSSGQPGEKLPCRDGSWWEPTCSPLPWGWKPLMQWQRGGSVTPAGLGPSPGAQNSQTCCSLLQHRRHSTADSGCQQLLRLPKADGCPSLERASWQSLQFATLKAQTIPQVPLKNIVPALCILFPPPWGTRRQGLCHSAASLLHIRRMLWFGWELICCHQ